MPSAYVLPPDRMVSHAASTPCGTIHVSFATRMAEGPVGLGFSNGGTGSREGTHVTHPVHARHMHGPIGQAAGFVVGQMSLSGRARFPLAPIGGSGCVVVGDAVTCGARGTSPSRRSDTPYPSVVIEIGVNRHSVPPFKEYYAVALWPMACMRRDRDGSST